MSRAARCAVIWLPERNAYGIQRRDDCSELHLLRAADEGSFSQWIDDSSFAFHGKYGHLTLRKDARRYGEGYWYAYRNHGHRTLKKYVGRSDDLTIERLEDRAAVLAAEIRASSEERRQGEKEEVSVLQERNTAQQEHVSVPTLPFISLSHAPLLVSKLSPPRLHASVVTRPRLLALLDAGLERKLTLVSAPAGFGKTTLVSQWCIASREHLPPVAWVSLDAGDNDPYRFWRYVIGACQIFKDDIGEETLTLLASAQLFLEMAPWQAALTMFLNKLSQLPQKGMLVLEDYHVITTPQIQRMMEFLLEYLPATLHVVILTRVDPSFPLGRWRAHDDLCEVHASDLRFSQEESRVFLQQALPTSLSSEVMMQLSARLEGWVTGLYLVALALQGQMARQEVEQSLATFSGNHRYLLKYFVTEVLEAQAEPLQRFLLHTCVLRRLTSALCDAVTGREGSEALLEAAVDANLFLQALDESGQWYRYHALFAEAMRHEARQRLGEEMVRTCAGKASIWYEQQGMLREAVEAALDAHAFVRAALLIERVIGPQHFQWLVENETLRSWLETLPEAILEQHPSLCVRFAMVLLFPYNYRLALALEQAERVLQLAKRGFQAEGNRSGIGEVYAFRSVVATRVLDNVPLAARLARQALIWLPEQEQQWRGACLQCIGEEELFAGRIKQARQTLLASQACFEAINNHYAVRSGLVLLAEVCRHQGELRQAVELYRAVLDTAGEVHQFQRARARLGLARLSYEWNALDAAQQEAQQALEIALRLVDEPLQVQGELVLADIEQARGQIVSAQERVFRLLARIQPQKLPLFRREILARQARLALARGDLATVERWFTSSTCQWEAERRLQQEQEDLIAARLRIAQGKAAEALSLLESWQGEASQQGRIRSTLEIGILIALAHFAQKHELQSEYLLKEVLRCTSAEGYQRLFLDEGVPMLTLLSAVLPRIRKDLPGSYAQTLVQAFIQQQVEQGGFPSASSRMITHLTQPLSSQEQRVLRLLGAGYSNPEIASTLVISLNTVKTHVQSIYRKLNVKNRKEAREALQSF